MMWTGNGEEEKDEDWRGRKRGGVFSLFHNGIRAFHSQEDSHGLLTNKTILIGNLGFKNGYVHCLRNWKGKNIVYIEWWITLAFVITNYWKIHI